MNQNTDTFEILNTSHICDNLKNKEIILIYTIGFDEVAVGQRKLRLNSAYLTRNILAGKLAYILLHSIAVYRIVTAFYVYSSWDS